MTRWGFGSHGSRLLSALFLAISIAASFPASAQQLDGAALGDACTSCHGVAGHSQGAIPSIGGLDKAALLSMLQAYKANQGGPTIMNRILRGYSDADLAALADYFSSVKAP